MGHAMGTAVMHDLRGLYYLLTRVHMVDRAQVKVSREGAKCDDGDVTAWSWWRELDEEVPDES